MTEVDIGVIAYEACLELAAEGFTFGWHESQHPLNRHGDWTCELPGMPEPCPGVDPLSDPELLRELAAWNARHHQP